MDRAVHPAAAQHHLVRGVDDGIHRQLRDIALHNSDHDKSLSPFVLEKLFDSIRGKNSTSQVIYPLIILLN